MSPVDRDNRPVAKKLGEGTESRQTIKAEIFLGEREKKPDQPP